MKHIVQVYRVQKGLLEGTIIYAVSKADAVLLLKRIRAEQALLPEETDLVLERTEEHD